jgi:hypothetical protein
MGLESDGERENRPTTSPTNHTNMTPDTTMTEGDEDQSPTTATTTTHFATAKQPPNTQNPNHHYTLRYHFRAPKTEKQKTFNLVESTFALAEALFAANAGVQIIHARDRKKPLTTMAEWPTNADEIQNYFEIANTTNGSGTYVRISINANKDYATLREISVYFQFLLQNGILGSTYEFTDIRSTSAGLILFKHPTLTMRQKYQADLTEWMHESLQQITTATHGNKPEFTSFDFAAKTVPHFKVLPRDVSHSVRSASTPTTPPTQQRIKTSALHIICSTRDQERVTALLTAVCYSRDTQFVRGIFTPWRTKTMESVMFLNLLSTQSDFIRSFQATAVHGIAPEFWNTNITNTTTAIQETTTLPGQITSTPSLHLIQCVEPTRESNTSGKYLLVHHRQHREAVKEFVHNQLQVWYKNNPTAHNYHNRYLPRFPSPTTTQSDFATGQAQHLQHYTSGRILPNDPLAPDHEPQNANNRQRPPRFRQRNNRPNLIYIKPNDPTKTADVWKLDWKPQPRQMNKQTTPPPSYKHTKTATTNQTANTNQHQPNRNDANGSVGETGTTTSTTTTNTLESFSAQLRQEVRDEMLQLLQQQAQKNKSAPLQHEQRISKIESTIRNIQAANTNIHEAVNRNHAQQQRNFNDLSDTQAQLTQMLAHFGQRMDTDQAKMIAHVQRCASDTNQMIMRFQKSHMSKNTSAATHPTPRSSTTRTDTRTRTEPRTQDDNPTTRNNQPDQRGDTNHDTSPTDATHHTTQSQTHDDPTRTTTTQPSQQDTVALKEVTQSKRDRTPSDQMTPPRPPPLTNRTTPPTKSHVTRSNSVRPQHHHEMGRGRGGRSPHRAHLQLQQQTSNNQPQTASPNRFSSLASMNDDEEDDEEEDDLSLEDYEDEMSVAEEREQRNQLWETCFDDDAGYNGSQKADQEETMTFSTNDDEDSGDEPNTEPNSEAQPGNHKPKTTQTNLQAPRQQGRPGS